MSADKRHGAIILEFFGTVGLSVGKLWDFELVGVVKNYRWSDHGVDISL